MNSGDRHSSKHKSSSEGKLDETMHFQPVPNIYSDNVLVEGWDLPARNKEWKIRCFYRERRAKKLLIEKTRQRAVFLLRGIVITHKLSNIAYQQYLQIKASFMTTHDKYTGVALSSTLTDEEDYEVKDLCRSRRLSWSPHTKYCYRNVYFLKSLEGNKTDTDAVSYGDEFYILTASDEEHPSLYVAVIFTPAGMPTSYSGHSTVAFSKIADDGCIWTAVHALYEKRNKSNRESIPINSNLLLKNVRTGLYLAVEPKYLYHSLFGIELEATAYNHMTPGFKTRLENVVSLDVKPCTTKDDFVT